MQPFKISLFSFSSATPLGHGHIHLLILVLCYRNPIRAGGLCKVGVAGVFTTCFGHLTIARTSYYFVRRNTQHQIRYH
ncbi:hypothetical protein B0T26DRAFT_148619 [Lasiosphaeria miniovina]|uniref:Uncharacterized protein n=1 Tax=Lasiosphaeria miniovina TaxID=1954250 RepID=A0AA40E8H3_9PEZI|nr:uncharacterized protein B0T26DRAFT_148619 [Lasiosphaeria miniovina]KAK0727896.1 hypothetical protein B0T26DRAFT_148619 [Lasiosphaeria miniovina]